MKNCNGKSDDDITENAEMFYMAVYILSSCVTKYTPLAMGRFPTSEYGPRIKSHFHFYFLFDFGKWPTDVFCIMQICVCTRKVLYIHQNTARLKDYLHTKV